MSKGRKQKPKNLKLLQGTFRDDRANPNAPAPEPEMPMSPTWLTPEAREFFGILKERLDSVGLASKTFTEIHALTAQRMADMVELRQKAVEEGWDFRVAARYESAVANVKNMLAELGLTQVNIGKAMMPNKKNDDKKQGFGAL